MKAEISVVMQLFMEMEFLNGETEEEMSDMLYETVCDKLDKAGLGYQFEDVEVDFDA